jgi:hypothetical protein
MRGKTAKIENFLREYWLMFQMWCPPEDIIASERHSTMIAQFIELCEKISGVTFREVCKLYMSSTGQELMGRGLWYGHCYHDKLYLERSSQSKLVPFFEEVILRKYR